MRIILILLILNLEQFGQAHTANKDTIKVDGDLMIIALFSVHRKSETSADCGEIQEIAGMQRVETALRQIEEINSKKDKKCKLGIIIKDICEDPVPTDISSYSNLQNIVGIIGPATSEETYNLHPSREYTQVGYGATSPKLITREPFDRYHPYIDDFPPNFFTDPRSDQISHYYHRFEPNFVNKFIRVVPSDENQVKVITEIVKNVTNASVTGINIIGSPDKYGIDGVDEFMQQSSNDGVCIHQKFHADAAMKKTNFFEVLNSTVNTTQILVCFCDGDTLRDLLIAVKHLNMTQKFILIASDRWAERDYVLDGLHIEAERSFLINIKPSRSYEFRSDYSSLKSKTKDNAAIKWMKELQEHRFNCTSDNFSQRCNETANFQSDFQDPKLPFVIESIDVIDKFVEKSYTERCELKQETVIHEKFRNSPFEHGRRMLQYRSPSIFNTANIKFDELGNPTVGNYEIFNYQNNNGVFKLVPVGKRENNKFEWNTNIVQLPNIPKINSHCRKGCNPGQYLNKKICCWKCENCERNNYTVKGTEPSCTECHITKRANENKTGCEPKDEERIYWHEVDALICIIFSVFGISITLLAAVLFYKHIKAPIVQNSSPELLLIIFYGMILAYSYSFLLVIKPNPVICTIAKFVTSMSLTMIYGPLLARINRISRAFTVTKLREIYLKKEYFSNRFLMKLIIYFLAIEMMMIGFVDYVVFRFENIEDLVDENPYFEKKITFFCKRDETNQFNSRQLVNALLLVYCCVFAFKTIKLPDNFFESKFIVSSCGINIIAWTIYLLIFSMATTTRVVQISLSLVLSTNAFTCLVGFLFPKLYIVLWRPIQYKTYFQPMNKPQQDFFNNDSTVTMDNSFWEYLGVASRITPEIIDESELKKF